MNTSIELPSGKILNITRFIALIPNNNNIDSNSYDNSYNYWHVFMPQTRHIISYNGKIKSDC